MPTFVAVYHGENMQNSKLVAVSMEPKLVAEVATRLLAEDQLSDTGNPVQDAVARGKRHALEVISGAKKD
jgi:hypothetical protein